MDIRLKHVRQLATSLRRYCTYLKRHAFDTRRHDMADNIQNCISGVLNEWGNGIAQCANLHRRNITADSDQRIKHMPSRAELNEAIEFAMSMVHALWKRWRPSVTGTKPPPWVVFAAEVYHAPIVLVNQVDYAQGREDEDTNQNGS